MDYEILMEFIFKSEIAVRKNMLVDLLLSLQMRSD